MNNPLQILLISFMTIFCLGTANAESKKNENLVVLSTQIFSSFDPYIRFDWLSYVTLRRVCANLVGMGNNHQLINDLAKDITYSSDGKTVTFHLHSHRKFHNGKSIGAKDVAYSFNRMLNPKLKSPGANMFHMIKGFEDYLAGKTDKISGITVVDPLTVRFNIQTPSHAFLHTLTTNFGCIVPEGFKQEPYEFPISGGPLIPEELTIDGVLKLSRFHIDPPVYNFDFDGMDVHSGMSGEQILEWKARGLGGVVLDGQAWSSSNSNPPKDKRVKKSSLSYLSLNTNLPPFDNVNVRRAVYYGIDRSKIIESNGSPTSQIVPPAFLEHDDNIPPNIYDPERAASLLRNMETPIKAELYAVDEPKYREIVYTIAENLRHIGIFITPKFGSHREILKIGSNPDKGQMVFSGGLGWIPDYRDVSNFYYPLLSKNAIGGTGWNWSAYYNPKVDELAKVADSLAGNENEAARRKKWQEVFSLIAEEAPMIPLYNREEGGYALHEKGVENNYNPFFLSQKYID